MYSILITLAVFKLFLDLQYKKVHLNPIKMDK